MAKRMNLGSFTKKEDKELLIQLDNYLDLINENRTSNKISRLNFFSNAIKQELEGKVLTNDFIELEKPFYFNMKELIEKKTVKAVEKIPTYKRNEGCLVYKVPNNLDSFNDEFKTYCSGTPNNHKGIYIDFVVKTAEEGTDNLFRNVVKDIYENYFIFDYDSSAKSLDVSLVPFEDLFLYVPVGSSILEELEAEKDEFYNNIILDEETNLLNEVELVLKTKQVLYSYESVKRNKIYLESKEGKELLDRLKRLDEEEKRLGLYEPDRILSGAEHKKNYKELKDSHEKIKELEAKYKD